MNWRFWKKICANNSMEDDKQVSLTPALLNRDSESDKKQYRSCLLYTSPSPRDTR